jgi:hypothetical protein
MEVGVGMPAVDESFAPIAGSELAIGNGEPLEVEGGNQAKPVGERSGVRHHRGLYQPNLTE